MQPFLSIITINFNDASGLEKTVNSVLTQTYQDFEFIIIDGGSTDGSTAVIQKHQHKIAYWISEKDSGIFNAMNKGIAKAKGQYLQFLNSGDALNGNTALFDFIHHDLFKGDVIYGDYKFDKGGKIYPDVLTPFFFIKSSLPHQSTFFHKKIFQNIGGFDENFKIASDRDFFIKCFLSEQFAFQHIQYPLVHFDLEGISNNVNFKDKKLQEDELILKKNYGIFYQDYKEMLEQHIVLNDKSKTVKGILKRLIFKVKRVCQIR